MGAFLPIAAIALTAGGKLYEGVSEKKAQNRAAVVDRENGRLAYKSGEEQAMDVLREALFAQGEAAADLGHGLVFGGSVSAVLADSARAAELDIERVRTAARGEAANYYTQANERKRAGKAALVGGIFGAVATAVGGAAQLRQQGQMASIAASQRKVQLGVSGRGPKHGQPGHGWTMPRSALERWQRASTPPGFGDF